MTILFEALLLGLGLAMDAFAASVCKGLQCTRVDWKRALITAFSFGAFQAIMPLIGSVLGASFAHLIEPVDHWIAFGLLAAVGAKMLWDAFHDDGTCPCEREEGIDLKELLMLSVATSIDALVVGVSFPLAGVDARVACPIIGFVTFGLSLAGFSIGNRFGARFERPAAIMGGIVLILLGLKTLLEHLFS